jgi:DNA-binding NarL/FixJ family response regulator
MQVFIVDDSKILRESLKKLLKSIDNCRCCGEAARVSEAVPAILEVKPDVVILDVQLVDGLGFDVIDKVGQSGFRPTYIALTNYPTAHYKKLFQNRNIRYFFDKTTDFDKMVTILKTLC